MSDITQEILDKTKDLFDYVSELADAITDEDAPVVHQTGIASAIMDTANALGTLRNECVAHGEVETAVKMFRKRYPE